jgi:ribonuclease VapC
MFLDASIVVAVIAREPGWEEIVKRLETIDRGFTISPIVRFEAVLGLARKFSAGGTRRQAIEAASVAVEEFFSAIQAMETNITSDVGQLALEAAMTYGKVVGHPAALNFGDCFSYACAKAQQVELGYKGNDFVLTDLG